MRHKPDYINLPIELLTFSVRERKVNQLQLFIGLKSLFTNGQFILSRETKSQVCIYLGYKSEKTFNNNFQWLVQNRWVYFRKGHCIIKSFTKIAVKYDFTCYKVALFIPEIDMPNFKAFIYGAIITYLMVWKGNKDRRSGADLGSSYMKRNPVSSSLLYYNLPVRYMAKALNISKSTASNYKNIANDAGYIEVKHDYSFVVFGGSNFKEYMKWLSPEQKCKICNMDGKIYIQNPDLIKSNIIIKRNRPMRMMLRKSSKKAA
ncbi:MAG: hypothetical protein KQI35_17180 [Bacteroidetes bacterium]|nr:hypothetical protein [Bacteroidota bacterium]